MPKIRDILTLLNEIAPFDLSEDWDNSGLQVGTINGEVKKALIGLDASLPLLNFAKNENFDLIITHHPLMLHPEKTIDFDRMPGKAIEIAAKYGIGIISIHTNLDKAMGGLNDYFASAIGFKKTAPFIIDHSVHGLKHEQTGIGRIGYPDTKLTLKQLANQIKEKLNLSYLRVTGNMDMIVEAVAMCTGSGGSLIEEFINSKADVFITGDVKYHDARHVEEVSKGMIDVGHFGSEQMVVDLLFEKLNMGFHAVNYHIKLTKYKEDRDPFTIF
ncbi:MAG: Nif3-like dinuclear metal center hexameric protein [Desulfobacterales bacterium RIFOXYA12_FULL_46_15]|nr:MAG: Nif3-like dinuclear metal center hexameric protein [Desulfobacterales bacterium RIFOXYA12_FULL_46_15]